MTAIVIEPMQWWGRERVVMRVEGGDVLYLWVIEDWKRHHPGLHRCSLGRFRRRIKENGMVMEMVTGEQVREWWTAYLLGRCKDDLAYQAKLIATAVRNNIESFHAEYLSDEQMRILNPLIRGGIYTALVAMQWAPYEKKAARWLSFQNRLVPDYWEEPELMDDYREESEEDPEGQIPGSESL